MRFDELIGLWQEGERRLRQAAEADRPALERIVDALVVELRRRVGTPFTADDLASFYTREGVDWCFGVATRVAPDRPDAWDLTTISGSAFARFAREASDFGGGRRIEE